MTNSTNRFYIKPMFLGISKIMMIIFCLFMAICANKKRCTRNFARSNNIAYNASHLSLFSVVSFPYFRIYASKLFTFFALAILFLGRFTDFTSPIGIKVCFAIARFAKIILRFFSANFALIGYSIFSGTILLKFINWLDCFTKISQ